MGTVGFIIFALAGRLVALWFSGLTVIGVLWLQHIQSAMESRCLAHPWCGSHHMVSVLHHSDASIQTHSRPPQKLSAAKPIFIPLSQISKLLGTYSSDSARSI